MSYEHKQWFYDCVHSAMIVIIGQKTVIHFRQMRATSTIISLIVSAYRYIAITNLAIIAVFLEYLRHFLIDLHQTYRCSSVP